MTSHFTERFTGLYATPELVGRRDILGQFERILRDSSLAPRLVFLSGLGGIGKTRLLKKALELAQAVSNCRVAEDMLDFYHIMLHTPIGLANAIFEILTPPFDCFQTYQPAYQALNRARLSGNFVELDKLREDAVNKFDQDLKQLSVSRRVVLALDTAERVVYGLPGWTDEIPLAEAWNWLIEKLPTWQNVVIFVAGREGARPAIEKIKTDHPALVEEIEVGPFGLEESLEYFDKVAQLAKENGDYHLAERLQNLPQDFKRGAHTYSQGRPILLSMMVDHLSFPGESELPDMLRQALPQKVKQEDYRGFEEVLFQRLREGELGETLIALGRVPKGANEELLSKLINDKNGQPISRQEARKRLQDVQRLSVVKIRPEDQRVFLHDEMYALLQRLVYDSPYDGELQKSAFEALKAYYKSQREHLVQRLNELYAPVEEQGKENLDMKALAEAHVERQTILTETMYYHLHYDLGRGFRTYYRYSHEAILSRDVLMDLQLQAELLLFLGTRPARFLNGDISVEMILASLKIRPIARGWALGKYEEALKDAVELLEAVDTDWRSRFPALLAALHAWIAGLNIMSGQKDDLTEAETHLATVYSLLPEKDVARPFADPTHPETLLWYEKAISAFTHRVHGYLRRVQNFMRDAVMEYQKAAVLLREIDLRIEMATVTNDMGFAQAELGEWHDGRANVTDAMRLRRELGPRVPVALSINTLAAIDVREGQFLVARQNAERALAIFHAFYNGRGIGMALTTLSEATRRHAGTSPLLVAEKRIELLRQARDYAREAYSHFDELGETPRKVESLIEIGCSCRDWIWWLNLSPRAGDDVGRVFKESKDTLKQAADLAGQIGLIYRHVDALVNLAWLKFYMLEPEEDVSEKHSIYAFVNETEKAFPNEAEIDKQPQVWAQKGKLYVLKGNLAYRRLEQQRLKEPKGISQTITTILEDTATNYARGLDYSSRFASDYQGIRRAKDSIFENLKRLNAAEMRIICSQIKSLYPKGSPIQAFLTNRALWLGD